MDCICGPYIPWRRVVSIHTPPDVVVLEAEWGAGVLTHESVVTESPARDALTYGRDMRLTPSRLGMGVEQ